MRRWSPRVGVGAAITASADPPVGPLAISVSGRPVSIVANDASSCADLANQAKPAHLTAPLTVTITGKPAGTTMLRAIVGSPSLHSTFDVGNGAAFVIPVDGLDVANGDASQPLRCSDSYNSGSGQDLLYLQVSAFDGVNNSLGNVYAPVSLGSLSFTTTGGPVWLKGVTVNCANPGTDTQPALLSAPLTVTIDSVPGGTATLTAIVGFAGTHSGTDVGNVHSFTIPVDGLDVGLGQHLQCSDGYAGPNQLYIQVTAWDANMAQLDSTYIPFQLSAVD